MQPAANLFRLLADGSRRRLYERLASEGELNVAALTRDSGISQPAVSQHLAALKAVGLVEGRVAGRTTFYSARREGLKPISKWMHRYAQFWNERFDALENLLEEMDGERNQVVVERVMPHSPETIWRALTDPLLIERWLMRNDFRPVVGHRFDFHAQPVPGWSGVTHCEVLEVEPATRLAYRWGDGTESDSGLRTVVTWTLSAEGEGTLVRMEHSGFRPEDEAGYQGMGGGWPRILEGLERVAGEH